MYSVRKVASTVYKELLFQGYTASRLSGMRPSNSRSAIRASKWNKVILSVTYGGILAAMSVISYIIGRPYSSSLEAFVWSFFMVTISSLNLSFATQQSGYIKDLLLTLSVNEGDFSRIATLSFFMTMDFPVYSAIVVTAIISLLFGGFPYSFMGSVQGIAIGIATSSVFVIVGSKGSSRPRLRSIFRVVSILPLMVVVMFSSFIMEISPAGMNHALSLLPVTSTFFGGEGMIYAIVTLIYTAAFIVLALLLFLRASGLILSTQEIFVTLRRKASRSFNIRGSIGALLRVDMVQSFRSRIAGIWALPFGYLIAAIASAFSNGSYISSNTFMFIVSYPLILGIMLSFLPYALYLSEIRGAIAFRILPISPIRNLLSKEVIAVAVYYVAEVPMMALLLFYRASALSLVPLLLGFGPLFASTAFMAIFFEKTVKEGGALSTLYTIVYGIVTLIIDAIPLGAFIIIYILMHSYIYPSLVMLVISLVEAAVMMISLSKK
ncbi:MAG: hypothetical protein M1291_04055 [Thaumarchaeota archaeon]|nr:hypothetical protein [Nitrososphaerota archaeon]MDG6931849.1 hypothetical protein [Nitrososphaerota archaeon]